MAEAGSGAWPPPHPPSTWPGAAATPVPPPDRWRRETGPRVGVVPLRPLSLTEILDGAVATMRRHPGPTLTLAAVVAGVQALLNAGAVVLARSAWAAVPPHGAVQPDGADPASGADPAGGGADLAGALASGATQQVGSLVASTLAAVFVGAMAVVVSEAVLGRRVATRDVWRRVRPRARALIGLAAVTTLGPLAAVGIVVAVSAALAGLVGPLVLVAAVPLGLATLVAAVWLAVRWSLAAPALVLERLGVVAALRRSTALVRGSWWRVLGVRLLASALAGVVATFVTLPVATVVGAGMFGNLGGEPRPASSGALAGLAVAAALTSVVTLPFGCGVRALLYTDQRMRREALDLRLQQAAATGT